MEMPQLLPSSANAPLSVFQGSATLTVVVQPDPSNAGAAVTASGSLFDSSTHVPVTGAAVSVSGGGFSGSATTDSSGRYSLAGTAPSPVNTTVYTVTASFAGNAGYGPASASYNYSVVVQVATTLTIGLSPSTVQGGAPFTAYGKLTRLDTNAGVPSMPISVSIDSGSASVATTDVNGNYSISLIAPGAGSHTVTASFAGAVVSLSVLSPSSASTSALIGAVDMTPVIAGVSLVAGMALTAFAFSRRRRRR